MRLEERQVAIGDLRVGMYVCRLDRGWEGTPFPLQGVMVSSEADIDRLGEWARHVFVDIELGLAPDEPAAPLRRRAPARQYDEAEVENLRGHERYRDTVPFEEEVPQARDARRRAAEFAVRMLDDVRDGRPIQVDEVRDAVEPMVRSVLRNADAFLWVESLRQRDAYQYRHALNCSALAAAFGRHIGFPEDLLTDVASGGLLLDIGKARLPSGLVDRDGPLAPTEMADVRLHVEHGLDLLRRSPHFPAHIDAMVRGHHEREDGSGYPDGCPGARIPLLARIAGVIDSYDAMTNDRPHRKALSRHAALQVLYRERDRLYASEIVEQFMQCLCVYPTGSLVELNTGEVAVVMAQNAARRLRPRVMVLTAPDKSLLPHFRALDLMAQSETGERQVLIAGTLPAGAYGLDSAELYL